jgi:integrase
MVQTFYTSLGQERTNPKGKNHPPVAGTTRHHIARLLTTILANAQRYGIILQNPAGQVDLPRRERKEMVVWTEEQARAFLDQARRSSRHYVLYALAMTTGLRLGELLALKWDDLDFTRGVLHIRSGKTANARRAVSVPADLLVDLKARRAIGLVFCTSRGTPLNPSNLRIRDYYPTVKKAKVPKVRPHDLRHFHATHLLSNGVDLAVISARLGHSSRAFTLQTYAHAMSAGQERAATLGAQLVRH